MLAKRPSIYQTYGSLDTTEKKVTKSELIEARNQHNYKKPERYEPEVTDVQNRQPDVEQIPVDVSKNIKPVSGIQKILANANPQKNKVLSEFAKIVFFFNKKLYKNVENGTLLSPISIIFAIINVYLGSIGNTRLQIKNSFNISEKDNMIFQYLINSNKLLNIVNNDIKVRCSNSIVVRANFQIEQYFII